MRPKKGEKIQRFSKIFLNVEHIIFFARECKRKKIRLNFSKIFL